MREEGRRVLASGGGSTSTTPEGGDGPVGPATVRAVLRALAAVARGNRRREAEFYGALRRAGLSLDPVEVEAVLERLTASGSIERAIPLRDGGIFLRVTPLGLSRAEEAT